MDENVPIVVLSASEDAPIPDDHNMDLMEIKLDVFGTWLNICIGVENKPAKLSDLVPLARELSTRIVSATTQRITNNGDTIACDTSCSQCCRYLVPLTIPEAMRLNEEVKVMVQWERRFIDESSLLTARCILELTPQDSLDKIIDAVPETELKLKEISDWYSRMNLPCPFLLNNLCTIYEQRPIACREHLMTGSSSNCEDNANQTQFVQMPVSILKALADLTCELEQTTVEAIILPFALVWCHQNPKYSEHTWPASQLVRHFINILTDQNSLNNKPEQQETYN